MPSLRQEALIKERLRIVHIAQEESVTAAARRGECSRTTVYKLLARYQEGGLLALANRARGPREAISEEVGELVVALKTSALHRTTSKIQQLLKERHGIALSRQSIWRILSARGLARIQDPVPLVRFERPQPNQLWQLDLKEDVVFPFGKAQLLVAVDDASRYCVGGVWMRDRKEPTILGALAQLLARAGLPEAILTDRASVFFGPASRQRGLTTYQLGMETLGVKPIFAKPYKPRTKGKIEKLIGFLERDFIQEVRGAMQSFSDLQPAWERWCGPWYNQARPHASLGNLPPAHRYQPCRRAAPSDLRPVLAVEETRRVNRDATISLEGQRYPVPPEFMGQHVLVRRLGADITIHHAGRLLASYVAGEKCSPLELRKRSVLEVT
jgi:transposase InsO family protein